MKKKINNTFYNDLKEKWLSAFDHPIALLRAENALRNPWIIEKLGKTPSTVLDIGCGVGLLTRALAEQGHTVVGVDLAEQALLSAESFKTENVTYLKADAKALPFKKESFDAVFALDLLEHVECPEKVIAEAARVLKPGGLFFFHTFNRNLLSYLLIIKGVDLFIKNAPKNMHVYPLFIKPKELIGMCHQNSMQVIEMVGVVPNAKKWAFWKTAFTRKIDPDFSFIFTPSLLTGYSGFARK